MKPHTHTHTHTHSNAPYSVMPMQAASGGQDTVHSTALYFVPGNVEADKHGLGRVGTSRRACSIGIAVAREERDSCQRGEGKEAGH